MIHRAAIAFGSNLPSTFGERAANLREAATRIAALGTITALSPFYDTEPVGYRDQPRFLNAALLLESSLDPLPLLRALLAIEQAMGRDRSATVDKGPRVIDLDLLLFDDLILQTPELTLPHPSMHQRRFVLEPLAAIAPALCHPTTTLTIAELLHRLGG